jgi:hypothetical protein
MTRTEDRLRNYFAAVTDSVRAGNTRPLAPPQPHEQRLRRRGWQAWGLPLAAAASVLAVVALAVGLAGLTTVHRPVASPTTEAVITPPRYYAEVDGSSAGGSVVIMSTSSGAVVARVQGSALLRDPALSAEPRLVVAVAAAPDDRTFYVEMLMQHNQAWIFAFRVEGPGLVKGIARIRGGVVNGGYGSGHASLAVSPDGRSLALTTTSSAAIDAIDGHGGVHAVQDEIVVIDLRSGAHHTWSGGLYKAGTSFDLQDLSWADRGRSLIFVPAWCPADAAGGCPYSVLGRSHSQVRQLSVSVSGDGDGDGGSLAGSRVLLGAAVSAQEAISDRDGNLDVLTLSGPESKQGLPMTVTVEQFSASTGVPRGVLYRHAYRGHSYHDYLIGTYLGADPSGMYLLLGLEFDVSTVPNQVGWINHGSLRVLKVGKDDAELVPDAW